MRGKSPSHTTYHTHPNKLHVHVLYPVGPGTTCAARVSSPRALESADIGQLTAVWLSVLLSHKLKALAVQRQQLES